MQHIDLQQHLHLTTRDIAKIFGVSQTTINYWLKKHNLTVSRSRGPRPTKNQITEKGSKSCTKCGAMKPLNAYYRNKGNKIHSACKNCLNTATVARQRAFKAKCVLYKGSKCFICSYDRYQGAFDFHHLNSEHKDFSLATVKSLTFNDVIKDELDKCVLLCANCHREVHGGVIKL